MKVWLVSILIIHHTAQQHAYNYDCIVCAVDDFVCGLKFLFEQVKCWIIEITLIDCINCSACT